MHCSKCKTVIDKAVQVIDSMIPGESLFCKKCFANEFMMWSTSIERKK